MSDERTPLLSGYEGSDDPHQQFCSITGVPPSNTDKRPKVSSRSLYGRATHQFHKARALHVFMATLSTSALLSQVVIGAAVTALGASQSSHILITVFGATNTVIAGIVAYLKSRGQPMRTRMFRDDLERVVDEIENSEVMWLGITEGIHGYDEIDIDDKVTVRTEVARLMRLYERAMRSNVLNNPDNYLLATSDAVGTALRARPAGVTSTAPAAITVDPAAPPSVAAPAEPAPTPAATAPAENPDESPASAPPKPTETPAAEAANEPAKDTSTERDAKPGSDDSKNAPKNVDDSALNKADSTSPPQPLAPAADPDESPASSADPPKTDIKISETAPDASKSADSSK